MDQISEEEKWENNYIALVRYAYNIEQTLSPELMHWIYDQKNQYIKGQLEEKKVNCLQSLGFWKWDFLLRTTNSVQPGKCGDNPQIKILKFEYSKNPEKMVKYRTASEIWRDHYNSLVNFISANGRLPEKDDDLSSWSARQRQLYRKGKLTKNKISLLNSLSEWKWHIARGKKRKVDTLSPDFTKLENLSRLSNFISLLDVSVDKRRKIESFSNSNSDTEDELDLKL